MNWNSEADYIESLEHDEPGAEFSYSGGVQGRYVRMQYHAAKRAGAHDAAGRIAGVFNRQWPTFSLEY